MQVMRRDTVPEIRKKTTLGVVYSPRVWYALAKCPKLEHFLLDSEYSEQMEDL